MKCSRCGNLIIETIEEKYCYACGWRPVPIEPAPICRGMNKNGQCPKPAIRRSNYCLQHDKIETLQRKVRHDSAPQ